MAHTMTALTPLEVLYQTRDLVAINKPSGLLVHRSPIDRHETQFALQLLRDQLGQYVYPVHRLDKPTSGVLLFALNANAAKVINQQFTDNSVIKRYWAVVRGFADDEGTIDHPLREDYDKIAERFGQLDTVSRPAVSHYRSLARLELPMAVDRYLSARYSLLEVKPMTGRKHQIRRHMKHISHPVIGDAKHGKSVHNRFFNDHFDSHRLLLSCMSLEFSAPDSGETVTVTAGLDESFRRVLADPLWQWRGERPLF